MMANMGRSYGTPGGSLTSSATWAKNADVVSQGDKGERSSAKILDRECITLGGASVFHDVNIPGCQANIDHVVVAGRKIWLIDSKRWKPGFYWRVGQRAFRGGKRFTPAEKKTMSLARDRLERLFAQRGVKARFLTSHTVVWPSNTFTPLRLWALRYMPGARVVSSTRFATLAKSRCRGVAHSDVSDVMEELVRDAS